MAGAQEVQNLGPHWPLLAQRIGHKFRQHHVDDDIRAGVVRLFSADDAAILANIDEYPTGRRVYHALAVGDAAQIQSLMLDVEAAALALDCHAVSLAAPSDARDLLCAYRTEAVLVRELPLSNVEAA
ncbi:hypothetical protein [Aureimonas psammosilenae]|uniref:hypothetical protein n=1 Tax=Aureimonas psammosilenae TaxID=2495496 RepID=UPI00186A1B3A|nr:hypothetical protein [Aureimonas psammosilenae]